MWMSNFSRRAYDSFEKEHNKKKNKVDEHGTKDEDRRALASPMNKEEESNEGWIQSMLRFSSTMEMGSNLKGDEVKQLRN